MEKPNPTPPEYVKFPEAVTVSPDLVTSYQALTKHFGITPLVVYYPSSAVDVSPSVAFPESRVLYVEIDPQSARVLKNQGYEVFQESAETFIPPAKADVLVLLNPAIAPTWPARQVREGGLVVCNNYHHTADQMANNSEFQLVGIIPDFIHSAPRVLGDTELQMRWAEPHDADSFYIFQRIKAVEISDEDALTAWLEHAARKQAELDAYFRENNQQGSISIDEV